MNLILAVEQAQKKTKLPDIKTGDTVKVHQAIREGSKSRVQVFEGMVIRYRKPNSLQAFVTVRKIASGVGVEKSWFVHSPNVVKIEIIRRAKVRRAFISYMRGRRGKKARLAELEFDSQAVNQADERTPEQIDSGLPKATGGGESDEVVAPAEVVESTEELAQEEEKEAAKADPEYDEAQPGQDKQDLENIQGDDEALLPAEEEQAGTEKAEEENTKAQK